MSKHRKPDGEADADVEVQGVVVGPPTAPVIAPVKTRRNPFAERFLPHWGMLAIALFYVGFYASVGGAAVPQTVSLGFTGTLATWFGYLIQQSRKEKADT